MNREDIIRQIVMQEIQKREAILWEFAVSGAFINELVQVEQPSTGKWWIK